MKGEKKMDSIYIVASGSASVAYGNISQHAKEYIKKLFPIFQILFIQSMVSRIEGLFLLMRNT